MTNITTTPLCEIYGCGEEATRVETGPGDWRLVLCQEDAERRASFAHRYISYEMLEQEEPHDSAG